MLLHLLGYPSNFIGMGNHALKLHQELDILAKASGFRYEASDLRNNSEIDKFNQRLKERQHSETPINVLIGPGDISNKLMGKLPGKKVSYVVFETDTLPLGWVDNLSQSDLVLTPSKWGAEILRSELPHNKIDVVPEGVDPLLYHHWNFNNKEHEWKRTSTESSPKEECFRFLSVGKFENRKSFEELLKAFHLAFQDQGDVRLLLRIHNVFEPDYLQHFKAIVPKEIENRVLVIISSDSNAWLKPHDLAQLYRSSHCFVFPSKGEGWGLPLIESIACGTPYIATHYSGQTEFLQHCHQSHSEIEFITAPISDSGYFKFQQFSESQRPQWAMPDVQSIADQLKNVYTNWHEVKQQALINSTAIHNLFSWRASASCLVDTLIKHFPD